MPTSLRSVREEFRSTPRRSRFAPSGRSFGARLADLAALGRGGVPEFRSFGSRDRTLATSGTPPHGTAVGRCRLAQRGDGGDQLRRVACASAARGEQSVGRTSPPSRWLRQRATSPTSLRSVREEFRSTPRRRLFAPSGRSSGARLADVAALGRGGVPEFRSFRSRDRTLATSGTPPHGAAVGRCRLAQRGDGGDQLRRVACAGAARGEQSVGRTSPPSRWLRQRATSPTSLRSVREEFRSTPRRRRGARSRRSFGVPEFRIARSHARDLGNSSPRRCRGEVSPRAARRRRGPTPTGCVGVRCARRATRWSDLPSVSLASPASHLPDVASLRQGGVLEHASPTSLRSVREELRSTPPRRRFAPSGRSFGARLPDVASLRQGGASEHASPISLRSVEEEFRSTPARHRAFKTS